MVNTATDEEDRNKTGVDDKAAGAPRRIPLLENRIDSRELFVGTREITILHGGDVYRLRLTAQNKLILTK
jgi:hemin uptake protein HemP